MEVMFLKTAIHCRSGLVQGLTWLLCRQKLDRVYVVYQEEVSLLLRTMS